MGFWANLFGSRSRNAQDNAANQQTVRHIDSAARNAAADQSWQATYDNRNFTFTGDLAKYDYDTILRDKQNNITSLYELSDYFVDRDPIYRGIVKGVYTPFSVSDWRLIGANEKTKRKYEEYYERIGLRDRMWSIFQQYYKYGNVYVYQMEDGSMITLPVHKVRVSNVMMNGEPVLEFNAQSIATDLNTTGTVAKKDYINDDELTVRLDGYPPEVAAAVNRGDQWVQLNPDRTFAMQDVKEDWMRYAIPMIAACLTGLKKKAVIEKYENALLNLGIHSFIHVTYGQVGAGDDFLPNGGELAAVNSLFKRAMGGSAQAVTNPYAKANVIQPDTRDMFQYDKYREVNAEILSGGGISGIIVSGRSEDGSTFASAQVSMQTAAIRIRQARDNFCEMMNKINARLNGNGLSRSASGNIPRFTFPPVDLSGQEKFKEVCTKLWQQGTVSTTTMLETHGYDPAQEVERKKIEETNGVKEYLTPKDESDEAPASDGGNGATPEGGRPTLNDNERASDPAKSETGRQPKPSRPEGSEKAE